MRFVLALMCVSVACAAGSGCGRRGAHNLLLITLDTTRADRLGCYGSDRGLTPALDGLAAEGVVFENAYCTAPITLPSHATILTGLQPPEHGLRVNGESRLSDSVTTLAEALRDRGYRTGAFIGAFVLDKTFGLDQGFDVYDDDVAKPTGTGESRLKRERPGEVVARRALEWLRTPSGKPWFCWVHFYDPHDPYSPWESLFGNRFLQEPYDAEIAYVDRQVGALLDYLKQAGLEGRTLVVAVADHGESLGEHGEKTHGLTLYNAALKVPMIVRMPAAIGAGQRMSEHVSLVNTAPTVLDLLRLGPLPQASGLSLVPMLGGKAEGHSPCYAESDMPYSQFGWSPLRGLVSVPWKYVRSPKAELYDLSRDGSEMNNLTAQDSGKVAGMEAELSRLEQGFVRQGAAKVSLSADDRQALTSLGYAGRQGAETPAEALKSLPDVKDMLPLVDAVNEARRLLDAGRPHDALPVAMQLVAKDPPNADFQLVYATALGAVGRFDRAEPILRGIVDRGMKALAMETWLDASLLLASCHERRKDYEGAERALRSILGVAPDHVEALNGLAWTLATARDVSESRAAEALEISRKAIDLTAEANASFLETHAAALAAAGRWGEAVETAGRARQRALEDGQAALADHIARRMESYRVQKRFVAE